MDAQNILLIASAAINLGLWGLLFFRGRHKNTHLFFGFVAISAALWSGLTVGYRLPTDNILNWCRFVYAAAILVSLAFAYFSLMFPEAIKTNKFLLFLFSLPALAFIFLTISTNLVVADAFAADGSENKIIFGAWYVFYVLCFAGYFILSFVLLFINKRKLSGVARIRSEYILFGGFCVWIFAMLSNILLPLLDIFSLNWLGQVSGSLLIFLGTYAILIKRPMDSRTAAKKIIIYALYTVFVYGIFYFIIWLYIALFGGVYSSGAYLLGIITAPLFVMFFVWLNNKIKRITDRYLFPSLYSHQEAIAKLADELTNFIDLDKIVKSILKSIKETMQIEKAGILLVDRSSGVIKYEAPQTFGFNPDDLKFLMRGGFSTEYFSESSKVLIIDEIEPVDLEQNRELNQLSESMKLIGASLSIPMVIFGKLNGIIVLGEKVSGDPYTEEDINLLLTLSKQAAIAVYNAQLYREVQNFNKSLQQKIDQQTKEIKEAYEVEKQAHEELKKLDEAKNNFMLVTQHHLRTPLSVTRGYLDLLLKGVYGKIPKKVVEVLNIMEKSTRKEIDVVNDLLNVSPYQLGKAVIKIEDNISMIDILMKIVGDLKAEADKKNIYLKFEPSDDIPEILADKNQIKLALSNIVDNAIKYTKKGGVTVKISNEIFDTGEKELESVILIAVEDTGIGMSSEEQRAIFNKPFQRSKDIWKIDVVGKGIGLYISAQIIKAHRGKIWAESEGKNKGSAFFVQLPINKNSLKL